MTGERRTIPEDDRDNGAEASLDDRPTCQVEPIERGYDPEPTETTIRYGDPTLGVMAAEYALWGPSHDGRHVFGRE